MSIRFALKLGAAAAAVTFALPAAAQGESAADYPSRPIRIIVPYTPGAINDVLARRIAQRLSESLKQSVVVENKPGGGTVIGASTSRAPIPTAIRCCKPPPLTRSTPT